MASVEAPSAAEWESAMKQRLVFGHQSVGTNILSGLRALAQEQGLALDVVESREQGVDAHVVHFLIGRNEDPLSKIADFVSTVESGGLREGSVAMMKLCYLDFNAETDAVQLATTYRDALERLQREYPGVTFVAATAPLTTVQTGPKAWVKRLLGRAPAGLEENLKRKQFNDALRARFEPEGLLFDIARFESLGRETGGRGRDVEALDAGLTEDGGHLNTEGQRLVAGALVRFLASRDETRP